MPLHPASSMPRLRVAIAGGGIGGLTLGVALSHVPDIQVDIYESAQRFTEIGAGIGIWLRTWKILQALGLADDLARVATHTPDERLQKAFDFTKGDQYHGNTFYTMTVPFGVQTLHRADFQQVLARRIAPERAHFSKRLVSYTRAKPTPAPAPHTNSNISSTNTNSPDNTTNTYADAGACSNSNQAPAYTTRNSTCPQIQTGHTSSQSVENAAHIPVDPLVSISSQPVPSPSIMDDHERMMWSTSTVVADDTIFPKARAGPAPQGPNLRTSLKPSRASDIPPPPGADEGIPFAEQDSDGDSKQTTRTAADSSSTPAAWYRTRDYPCSKEGLADQYEIILHFADGTTASCDLLIGADGIKSATRLSLLHELASCADYNPTAKTLHADAVDPQKHRHENEEIPPVAPVAGSQSNVITGHALAGPKRHPPSNTRNRAESGPEAKYDSATPESPAPDAAPLSSNTTLSPSRSPVLAPSTTADNRHPPPENTASPFVPEVPAAPDPQLDATHTPSALRPSKLSSAIREHEHSDPRASESGSTPEALVKGTTGPVPVPFPVPHGEPPPLSRAALLALADPFWSGTVVYRHLIPSAALKAAFDTHRALSGPVVYLGKNKHVLAFPISQGRAVNLVAFCSSPEREGTQFDGPWVESATGTELRAHFEGWDPEVHALLELADTPTRWAIHVMRSLPSYTAPGVALLGDAAHAMTPHQGAGGGQAIEDAYVLAALLAHPHATASTLPHVLRAYDAIRVPISQAVVASSRLNGMMYEFNHAWPPPTSDGNIKPEIQLTRDAALGDVKPAQPEATRFPSNASAPAGDKGGPLLVAGDGEHSAGQSRTVDADLQQLQGLAAAIMDNHKWEWEPESVDQRQAAMKLFEALVGI